VRDSYRDVIIIGAGIAGLTAALYTARQKLDTLVISIDLGGQLLMAPEIQNFPGYVSISGFELIKKIEEQARLYGAEIIFDEVVGIKPEDKHYIVSTRSGAEYRTLAVILAFGKKPKELGIPGEKELKGRGVSYCVVCDGPLFRNRNVALISWGHHSVESATTLRSYANRVYWIFPGEKPVDDEDMLNEILSGGNVELVANAKPVEIRGEKMVEAIVVEDRKTGERREINVDGVFVEIGYTTKTDFLKGLVELNEKGEVVVDQLCRTSREGIFAAGDVAAIPYKQAVISAGMGACAALSAYNHVIGLKGGRAKVIADWRKVEIPKKTGKFFLKI